MLDAGTRGREHVRSAQSHGRISKKSGKELKVKRSVKSDANNLDAPRTQWTLKGIDKQTLDASRVAARKRGMKFGAWVNEVLLAAASGESFETFGGEDRLLSKIADIEFKLDQSVSEIKQQTNHIQHDVRILQLLVPKVGSK